ncbi:hypothetical protein OSSY52_05220 [Tepiditoga spiralis]|uniref:Prepilin-type N-terminal cleavage/methylation domain-containing protein n=1 Tax=Tepiditoga spiralis TaxID=2108365 RepID=A0A7G1G247_9BACT|nr:hypothetical protein [Tepiditoga spiralis]BBE30381.1 hypothetical protein OSSY52_05220 [Tepiditoga spiralis]
MNYKSGFLSFEIIIYLLIEIIFFGATSFFISSKLYDYFDELSNKAMITEMILNLRITSLTNSYDKSSAFVGSVYLNNGFGILNYNFKFNSGILKRVSFVDGKYASSGGFFEDDKNKKLLNLIPVTGAITKNDY